MMRACRVIFHINPSQRRGFRQSSSDKLAPSVSLRRICKNNVIFKRRTGDEVRDVICVSDVRATKDVLNGFRDTMGGA